MFELPDAVYFRMENGIAVNLYTESELTAPEAVIRQTTRYPESEVVEFSILAGKAFTLKLRIPGWCGNAAVQDRPVSAGWFDMEIPAGETHFSLRLPMEVRQIRGTMAQAGRIALMRGPFVYAVEMERNQLTKHEIDLLAIEQPEQCSCTQQGIRIPCCIPNKGYHPREVLFTRFSAEKRTKTYFSIRNGNIACTEEDCLLRSPEKKL